MLRFVVELKPDFGEPGFGDPDSNTTKHFFNNFGEAEGFAIKNKHRFVEFYSEEKRALGTAEYWNRHTTYNIYADPNQ